MQVWSYLNYRIRYLRSLRRTGDSVVIADCHIIDILITTKHILNYMIISRTPFRISFAGGGTDLKEFYQHEPGAVVSTTIDKYVYLSMHPLFNKKGYFLKYSENEICENLNEIKHPIIREVFAEYDICGVDFNSSSDVPSGTGLGSSSSFTVGLINLCSSYKNTFVKKEDIAREACWVEINRLKSPIGKQDQYASAVGGLNYIQFNPDESVVVEKIRLSEGKIRKLEDSLILFYLGDTRKASSVLEEQQERTKSNIEILRKMANLALELKYELKNDYIDNFGKILHEGWMYKKELSSNIANPTIDYWYDKALKNGAIGGKVLGAGGTGFLLLYAPGKREILRLLIKLYELPFKFENSGTTIIY
jgi:D-glycero-alpha-D-manno-heptose-7-phosphate kinase